MEIVRGRHRKISALINRRGYILSGTYAKHRNLCTTSLSCSKNKVEMHCHISYCSTVAVGVVAWHAEGTPIRHFRPPADATSQAQSIKFCGAKPSQSSSFGTSRDTDTSLDWLWWLVESFACHLQANRIQTGSAHIGPECTLLDMVKTNAISAFRVCAFHLYGYTDWCRTPNFSV